MNWLRKVFTKKKKSYNTDTKYKLLIIDDEADLLHLNLGISDSRAESILKECILAFEKNKCVHNALVDLVDQCKHTNEVVFASLMMAKLIEKTDHKNKLHAMLKDMFNNG